MKAMVGVVVIANAIGCTGDSPETAQTQQAAGVRCPNPDDCTMSNGGGVYTEECGNAHMGPNDFMITHFVNHGGSVTVDGRAYDQSTGDYVTITGGEVFGARYLGVSYFVYAVKETLTKPEFDLGDTGVTPVSGDNIVYDHDTGSGISNFQLFIKANSGDYTLTFWSPVHETDVIGSDSFIVNTFDARWNVGEGYDAADVHEYCHLAPDGAYGSDTSPLPCPFPGLGSADSVVFQQGIDVDAVKAHVRRNGNDVTLSCRQGAIASVRSWGYKYRGTDDELTMFVAAMQMKRASYCGDEFYFTKPHTNLWIKDDLDHTNYHVTASTMESSWGAGIGGIQARCINLSQRRHPEMTAGFDLTCGNTVAIAPTSCPLSGSDWGSDGTGHLADRLDPYQTM